MKIAFYAVLSLFVLTATACGGGGSSGGSSSASADLATTFAITSQATFSVEEGSTAVGTVTTNAAAGSAVSYSLSGDDAEQFSISSDGVLTFAVAPDYEAPTTGSGGNDYSIVVTATSGASSASRTITISVTDDGLYSDADYTPNVFADRGNFENLCGAPRTGVDSDGQPYPDQQGSFAEENAWLRSMSNDLYLWYDEIEDVNPNDYGSSAAEVQDYFGLLKTFATSPSGNDKDKFHFSEDTEVWNSYASSGVQAGYGMQWELVRTSPPREILVAYTQPNSPATQLTEPIARGAKVISVDGVDVANGSDIAKLNAGLFPSDVGSQHTFEVMDLGASTTRSVTLTSAEVTIDPVQHVKVIETDAGKVGYFMFTNFIATAEKELYEAVETLSAGNVTDLVIDLRYNGGGYLAIASQLSYMIAGATKTSGATFEATQFNDKHPSVNPVTGQALQPTPFYNQTVGFSSLSSGLNLPTLDLERVFVLAGPSTCSASEAVINGLRGIDVEVIQIGDTTCGKPYGFYGMENCGTTYFTIQFRGVNAKGFGDYSDGFSPTNLSPIEGVQVPGCTANDDFTAALGDPSEEMLATALSYRTNQTCPETSASGLGIFATQRNLKPFGTGSKALAPPNKPGRILGLPQ